MAWSEAVGRGAHVHTEDLYEERMASREDRPLGVAVCAKSGEWL